MLDKITVHGQPRPVTDTELTRLEEFLSSDLPAGYSQYVMRLGYGCLGDLIYVHTPDRIMSGSISNEQWYKDLREDGWDWDEALISEDTAEEHVYFSHTVEGDALVFHPDDPQSVFVLPTDSTKVRQVSDSGLLTALSTLLDVPTSSSEDWFFYAEER